MPGSGPNRRVGDAFTLPMGRPRLALLSRFVLAALLLAGGSVGVCGGGPSAAIDLPIVGTVGCAPAGPGSITVRVTADGRITLGEAGPLGLDDLGRP